MDYMGSCSSKCTLLACRFPISRRPRRTLAVSSARIDLVSWRRSDSRTFRLQISSSLDFSTRRDSSICDYAVADAATNGHGNVTGRAACEEAFGGGERRGSLELARD